MGILSVRFWMFRGLSEDVDAFLFRYGEQAVAGQWSGGLSNRSETLALAVGGQIIQQVRYDDAWHPVTDGAGFSLELVDSSSRVNNWSQSDHWQPSGPRGGTSGSPPAQVGDANRDGIFNDQDLLQVFQFGKYLDEVPRNASWEEGDWNRDGKFDDQDLVVAFMKGRYVADAGTPGRALSAVVDAVYADDEVKTAFGM